ncbi:MAG: TonB-dependent receptor [Bacteroidaceae bacterium]|nr:TonB-dependent receptor [Bacteroidaceae bacterium]
MKRNLFFVALAAMPAFLMGEEFPKDSTMAQIVVTGTRNETAASSLPVSLTVVNHEKLQENSRLSILPTLTEQVPGLFSTSRGVLGYGVSTGAAGNIKIRGVGSGAQLLVLVDGQPQYAGLMGHPIPDAYQTMMAERVEVLRGPASLYYGSNAMAGVVNIVTRQMKQDGQKTDIQLGGGSYGTLQGEAVNRARIGRFSSIVGISYQRTDGHRANSNFEQEAGFVKLGYDLSENWQLTADANLTHFNASNPGPANAPLIDNDSKITRGLASFSVLNNYGKTNGSLRGYYDWGRHNIDDGYGIGGTPRAYHYLHNDHIAGITWYQSASFFEGNRVTVGLDWQHFGGEAWNRFNDGVTPSATLADTTQNEVGAYVDFRQEICSWFSFDAGVRLDWHSQAGTELVPQGGVTFHPSSSSDLKAIVSKGFRNPIIREMYMFPPHNPNLEPERMTNYELSYAQRFQRGHLGANLFLIKGDNLINTVMQATGRPLNVNTGSFTNHGFELSGDYQLTSHWGLNANYSYLHMKKAIEGAPEGKFYLGANYTCGRFALVMGLQHISGLHISATEKEDFTLLNATASYRILPELAVYVKGDNLLAERYQTYAGFPMPKATFMGGVRVNL